MHIKKHLSFSGLKKQLGDRISKIEDWRDKGKAEYSMQDFFMSGFAMMYFQDPSILQFQQRLEDAAHQNNLKTIFGVERIPKETQMRDVIDKVSFRALEPVFSDWFLSLQRGKHLEQYQFLPGEYLVSIDATGYFGSDKVNCPGCLFKEEKKGSTHYYHLIEQAVLMHPGCKQVIPICPEPVINTDGTDKQDCEINAGKRLIEKIHSTHPKLKLIIVGDSLYSKQPFINKVEENNMRYILVAKPDDHKCLKEFIEGSRKLGEVLRYEVKDLKGRKHIYEWENKVSLNGNENSCDVNYFEYWLEDKGKVTYHNSWVTDIEINEKNIEWLVKGGRCRWKIENETFNTLKNQGYHIEHNFGHGKKNLSMNFFLLNLLAFFMHQIFELTCLIYQRARAKFGRRDEYWNQLRCTLRILIFNSWEELLYKIIDPKIPYPLT